MKILKYYLLLSLVLFAVLSCNKDSNTTSLLGNWVDLSDFEGVARYDAVAFTIGDYGYVGTGFDGEVRLKDFWKYDSELNSWTQIADFPGAARNGAVAFSVNGIGYVGTGYDGQSKLQDFYSYDPSTDSWDTIADFEGSAR